MNSHSDASLSSIAIFELLGKTLGPVIVDAFKPRSSKAPAADPSEVDDIVNAMVNALKGQPTAGAWHVHQTMGAEGVVLQVLAGKTEVTGPAMTPADAKYIAAVNPEAMGKLMLSYAAREKARTQAEAEIARFDINGATLEKLHNGDGMGDEEIIGLVRHFRKLDALLTPLGATWRLAGDGARRELIRAEDMLRSRGLTA